jgi:homoserine O-acetyltransferase/O-succinyltransferase
MKGCISPIRYNRYRKRIYKGMHMTKRSIMIFVITAVTVFLYKPLSAADSQAGDLQYAELGDFRLESGETINECRIAYRTFGKPNISKSNIILFPTWLMGTTQDLIDFGYIGKGKMIDTTKYCVIAVDAIGNGVSSSPSNSKKQPYDTFPLFSVKDMVNSQYILLTKNLKINHIYAVAGISMGGMQAFQWIVSYPDFMDRAVSIAGSPCLTSQDKLAWTAELKVIESAKKCSTANDEIMKELTPIQTLFVWTPKYRVENTKSEDFAAFLAEAEKALMNYNATNWAWQLKAIMTQDIFRDFGGSAGKAAEAVHARAMVITSAQDYAVYPGSARAFAVLINAEAPQLTGDCGHFAFLCEIGKLDSLVNGFLGKSAK